MNQKWRRPVAVITDCEGECVAAIPLKHGKNCILKKGYTLRFCDDSQLSFEPINTGEGGYIVRCRIEEQGKA